MKQQTSFERSLKELILKYPGESVEILQRYIDFRNEGYSMYQSKLMAGMMYSQDEEQRS